MLTEIQIKRFKGIDELILKELGKINVIIGKNDSGKTAILEAIFAFKCVVVNPPHLLKTLIRSISRQQNFKELFYKYQITSNPRIKLVIDNSAECKIDFHSDFTGHSIDINFSIENRDGFLKLDPFLENVQTHNQINVSNLNAYVRSTIIDMEFFDLTTGRNTQLWESNGQNPILTTDEYDTSIEKIKLSDYTRGQRRLALTKEKIDHFIDGFGDGHKSGLGLLSLAERAKNSIILIDEIETHQHPSSLNNLINKLDEICTKNNNQIFVTTHSPDVLRLFNRKQNCKFYHLINDSERVSIHQIQHNDLSMMQDVGWNIGDFLTYQKFVIVEGLIDQLVFRTSIYKHKNVWPEEMGITIIATGDKDQQLNLLRALAYSDKTVFIQRDLDNNKKNEVEKSIIDSFKTLKQEGYKSIKDDNKEIVLQHENSGVQKKLLRNNIIITGEPDLFPQIKKHTIEDYLLLLLQNQPEILTKMGSSTTTIPTKSESSKEILQTLFPRYGTSTAEGIIRSANNVSSEFSTLITKILE